MLSYWIQSYSGSYVVYSDRSFQPLLHVWTTTQCPKRTFTGPKIPPTTELLRDELETSQPKLVQYYSRDVYILKSIKLMSQFLTWTNIWRRSLSRRTGAWKVFCLLEWIRFQLSIFQKASVLSHSDEELKEPIKSLHQLGLTKAF